MRTIAHRANFITTNYATKQNLVAFHANNRQDITTARTIAKANLTALKVLDDDNPNSVSVLFDTWPPDSDHQKAKLIAVANIINMATVVGREHTLEDKYKHHRQDMPTRVELIAALVKQGISHQNAADILNLTIHEGSSEINGWFGIVKNFHIKSAQKLYDNLNRKLNNLNGQGNIDDRAVGVISHKTIKTYYASNARRSRQGNFTAVKELITNLQENVENLANFTRDSEFNTTELFNFAYQAGFKTPQQLGAFALNAGLSTPQQLWDFANHAQLSSHQDLTDFAINAGLSEPQQLGAFSKKAGLKDFRKLAAFANNTRLNTPQHLGIFAKHTELRDPQALATFANYAGIRLSPQLVTFAKYAELNTPKDLANFAKQSNLFTPEKLGNFAKNCNFSTQEELIEFALHAGLDSLARLGEFTRYAEINELADLVKIAKYLKLNTPQQLGEYAYGVGCNTPLLVANIAGIIKFSQLQDLIMFAINAGLNTYKLLGEFAAHAGYCSVSKLIDFTNTAEIQDPEPLGEFAKGFGLNNAKDLLIFAKQAELVKPQQLAKFANGFGLKKTKDLLIFAKTANLNTDEELIAYANAAGFNTPQELGAFAYSINFKSLEERVKFAGSAGFSKPQELGAFVKNLDLINPQQLVNFANIAGLQDTQELKIFAKHAGFSTLQEYKVTFDFTNQTTLPQVISNHIHNLNIVVGDLHGNFHKLVDHFIRSGALMIDENDYTALLKNPDLIESFIQDNKLQIKPNHPKLLLLGDIFADRNPNDIAKLKLLDYVSNRGCQFTIIYSNHDAGFVQHLKGEKVDCEPARLTNIENKDIIMFKALFAKHYKFCELENGYLFTHAPLNSRHFNKLANCAGCNSELTIEEKVTRINDYFKNSWDNLKIFHAFVWARMHEWIPNQDESIAKYYNLRGHICGHDPFNTTAFNRSLDNNCGKPHYAKAINPEDKYTETVLLQKWWPSAKESLT